MLDKLSKYLSQKIMQHSQNYEKAEIYVYGLQLILSTSFTILSIILSSIYFYRWYDAFIFLFFFIPIRLFAGGYHACTYLGCYICSNTCFHISIILGNKYILNNFPTILFIFIAFSLYILFSCPILHQNNLLSTESFMKNKKYLKITLILEFVAIYLLYKFVPTLSCKAIYTSLIVAFMVYITNFKEENNVQFNRYHH